MEKHQRYEQHYFHVTFVVLTVTACAVFSASLDFSRRLAVFCGFARSLSLQRTITSRFFPKAFSIGNIFESYFAIKYILRLRTKCPFSIFDFLFWFGNISKRLKIHEKIRALFVFFRMPPLSKQHFYI